MHHYLAHLISDMRQAATRVPQLRIPKGEFDPDYMLDLENSAEKPMNQWFDLEKETFPPSEKLTKDQLELMAEEFEKLWADFSFFPDFPEGLPAKRRYELMREYLDHPTQHWPGGWQHHFEFCNGEPENCPFGSAFCRCKDFEDDEIEIKPNNRNGLPF